MTSEITIEKAKKAEKALTRSRLLRDRTFKSIKEIYSYALSFENKSEQVASLSSRIQILKETFHRFREKQSVVIDALMDLGRDDEFEKADSMELMYF